MSEGTRTSGTPPHAQIAGAQYTAPRGLRTGGRNIAPSLTVGPRSLRVVGYRTVMAALVMTGVPRSFVLASTRMVFPSFQYEVTMVSPGKTTPAKRAW